MSSSNCTVTKRSRSCHDRSVLQTPHVTVALHRTVPSLPVGYIEQVRLLYPFQSADCTVCHSSLFLSDEVCSCRDSTAGPDALPRTLLSS